MRGDLTSPEQFEALVREHQRLVFRTLTRLTGPGPQVEDLAQEVFLRLYRALPHFRGDSTISTYLYRIVVNVAQDEWKRRRKERAQFVSEPVSAESNEEHGGWIENFAGDGLQEHVRTPEQRIADAEVQAAVEAAMSELAEMERTVLVLYHQEECSYEGIAAALGLPINTVRTHLHRGRKHLSDLLREVLCGRREASLGGPVRELVRSSGFTWSPAPASVIKDEKHEGRAAEGLTTRQIVADRL